MASYLGSGPTDAHARRTIPIKGRVLVVSSEESHSATLVTMLMCAIEIPVLSSIILGAFDVLVCYNSFMSCG